MRVFQRKPAYSVTMKDIIKESGLSQGGVYKYYSNIDKIVVSLLNTSDIPVNPKELLNIYEDDPEKAIFELFDAFRQFFFITAKEFGKMMFELQAFFFNNKERLQTFKDNINKNLILNYWFVELLIFIDEKIDEKYFKPIIKPHDIYMQMIVAVSGIGNELILNKYYDLDRKLYYYKGEEDKKDLDVDLDSLIDTLYKTLLLLLGSQNVHKYSFKN
ncbi:TetR/AcrR family transcriptional regulator [Brachyspira sp.]|uniref:TetR/AcrR family transcriptional regulator n=1 Tax=Brachyspira sp. TaxID=1977261 RepID=UPI0026294A49|nr:helix-turn-helix domain-containing protein [Brachyspira sp.]